MREFDYRTLAEMKWSSEILSYVAKIHEYKGRQERDLAQRPAMLARLVEIARIQSTESSNRIEGIVTTSKRLAKLVADKTTPHNRDEGEILGYRNVLALIHEHHEDIPLSPNIILQLHRDMLSYTHLSYGGHFKNTPNEIDMTLRDGRRVMLFRPLDPYETPDAVERICASFREAHALELVDDLLLIPCFILDFLCIHPFNDGNGRMSRLLTLLLLYQSGYMVGRYISVEKAIADTKESYYEALRASNQGWHEGGNHPEPFVRYMLSILLKCYRDLDARVEIAAPNEGKLKCYRDIDGRVEVATPKRGKVTAYEEVRAYVAQKIGWFTKKDVLLSCPNLGSSSVEAALKRLTEEQNIQRKGKGRATRYKFSGGVEQHVQSQRGNL